MNKSTISIIILILVSIGGIGAFWVFQKPAFSDNKPVSQIEKNNSTKEDAYSKKAPTTAQPPVTPAATLIYHGVTTHSWTTLFTPLPGQANAIKAEVDAYEAAVGRAVAWVGFAHEWKTDGRAFPSKVATSIKNRGATPLIYLTLRSVDEGQPDPVYNLAAIIAGKFDSNFIAWADAAKKFGSELIVSWGWEMNGDWAAWSGALNGGAIEGPQRFRKAYRHIVELMRNRGAHNIRWVFHINFPEYPSEPWNAFENYYPGDDVIDATGVSIYGAQNPTDTSCHSFVTNMDTAYSRLIKMAPMKPVFVFEFATPKGHPLCTQVTWADDALSGIFSGRWPSVCGFAWWNDYWSQDNNPAHDTEMRVEKLHRLATVFKSRLSGANDVGDRPPIFTDKNLLNHTTPAPLRAGATLKTLAEQRGIRFGAMYQFDLRGDIYDQVFEREMSAMTAGTFWTDGSYKSRTEFDFSEMDAKVNWGRARGMDLHGHILVWFDDIPDWLKATPTSDVEAIMNEHIDTVVGRYAGQIKVWDVVNEAVNEESNLRQNHKWAEAMGDDYIRKAFLRAHAADPNAVLRYNDYDLESNEAKYNGVKKLLKNLLSNGVPVHALGWQMHLTPDIFDPTTLLMRFNEIADMGLDNYITELDVELPSEPTTADYEKQKQDYKSVINVFLSARRHKTIVIWGLRDGDPYWLTNNHPLPFDENYKKKPAYDGIQEALFGL